MSESDNMYDELQKWITFLQRLQRFAVEMQSREQDIDYLNKSIDLLIEREPDDSDAAC